MLLELYDVILRSPAFKFASINTLDFAYHFSKEQVVARYDIEVDISIFGTRVSTYLYTPDVLTSWLQLLRLLNISITSTMKTKLPTVGKRNYFGRLIPYFTTYKFCTSNTWSTVSFASFAWILGRNVNQSWFRGIKRNLLCWYQDIKILMFTIGREVRNMDSQNISRNMEFFIVPSLLLLWVNNTATTGSSWSRIP